MPRVLTVASQKGGVGKTTVALNLAYALAERGWRVLLVDTDPQGSLAASIGAARDHSGLLAWLRGDATLQESWLPTRVTGLYTLPVPADGDATGERANHRFGAAELEQLRCQATDIDLLLIDTPSGLRGVTRELVAASDDLLVPLQAEPLALRTIVQVLDLLGSLRDNGGAPRLAGFLLTMLDTRSAPSLMSAQAAWSDLPRQLVLETSVPRDPAILQASAAAVPVALLSRRPPPVAAIFDRLAAELEPLLLPELSDHDESLSLLL